MTVFLLAVEDLSLPVDLLLLFGSSLSLVGIKGVDSVDIGLYAGWLVIIVLTHLAFFLILFLFELFLVLAGFLLFLNLLFVCYLLQLLSLRLEVRKLYIIYYYY